MDDLNTYSPEQLHEKALEIAEEAFLAQKKGDANFLAITLFSKALQLEIKAASFYPANEESEPIRSILYRSAASLAFHAKQFKTAKDLINQGLEGYPSSEIEAELKQLQENLK